jgi:hypothetical protein
MQLELEGDMVIVRPVQYLGEKLLLKLKMREEILERLLTRLPKI